MCWFLGDRNERQLTSIKVPQHTTVLGLQVIFGNIVPLGVLCLVDTSLSSPQYGREDMVPPLLSLDSLVSYVKREDDMMLGMHAVERAKGLGNAKCRGEGLV